MPKIFGGASAAGGTDVAAILTTDGDILTRTAGALARMGLGTALQVLRVNAGATALEFATNSATDSTKLALDGSNDMSANISFSGETAATGGATREIGFNSGGGFINVPTGKSHILTINGVSYFELDATALYTGRLDLGAALSFSETQTSAGAAIANIFRESTGDLNYNVASTLSHKFSSNGTVLALFGGPTFSVDIGNYQATGVGIVKYTSITIYSPTPSMIATTAGHVTICAGTAAATDPEVVVNGVAHTSSPGALTEKVGMITRVSNGTWTNVYSLAAGEHHGLITVYDSIGGGVIWYDLDSATLTLEFASPLAGLTYVNAASAAATNVALRVSGGFVQINVGTSIAPNTKFGIQFEGGVI